MEPTTVIVSVPPSTRGSNEVPRPSHHDGNGFINPWPSFRPQTASLRDALQVVSLLYPPNPPVDVKAQLGTQIPTWGADVGTDRLKATWLGHACFLVELPALPDASRGPRILFDPVFSKRCSPSQGFGPARYTVPTCNIEDIPEVDAIVISHNHFDHMDTHTIATLSRLQNPHIFAPLGNEAYFSSLGITKNKIHCLDWWESRLVTLTLPIGSENAISIKSEFLLTCTPAQHLTGRGLFDRFKSLWGSWAVEQIIPEVAGRSTDTEVKVWFAGDTGYRAVKFGESEDDVPCCPAFKEIGDKFGGFDLALIPIGAYLPRSIMSPVHCAPQDSVRIFEDVRAKRAIGMHWGTWRLTIEDIMEPPKLLAEECKKIGIAEGLFGTCGLGETVVL